MSNGWDVDFAFSDSMVIYRGYVGDNKSHSHWASQITIALTGQVEFECRNSGLQSSDVVIFSSKTEHRLFGGHVCSIYFDPLAQNVLNGLIKESLEGWTSLPKSALPAELSSISTSTNLQEFLASEFLQPSHYSPQEDQKYLDVLAEIQAQLSRGDDVNRDELARLAGLSPSRFSHWFVEQSGVPFRSYKKWLKLKVALSALMAGEKPAEAASLAGFSDQAHMSRAFSQAFGVTYLSAQEIVTPSLKN